MSAQLIDLDAPPEVVVELAARVDVSDAGPVLVWSSPRQALTGLGRMAGAAVRVFLMRGKKRSSAQNRWYWAVIVPAVTNELSRGRELPLSREQTHWLLKLAFAGGEETALGVVPVQSRQFTTVQFSNYCEAIRAHAASEWGLNIPGPNEAESA